MKWFYLSEMVFAVTIQFVLAIIGVSDALVRFIVGVLLTWVYVIVMALVLYRR